MDSILLGISTNVQLTVIGAVIIVAVTIDLLVRSKVAVGQTE